MRTFLFCLLLLSVCFEAQAGIRAKAAILYNLGTGKVLYELNATRQLAPASLTKIMTIFLALDAVKAKKLALSSKVPITHVAANIGGSSMGLIAGEKVPLVRLLAGMAVASGNDAATAVAIKLGGSLRGFAAMMNAKARRLGMSQTRYKNPTGLPAAGHTTTAWDLLKLCRAYLKTHPNASRFHAMTYFMHKGSVARNTNPLLGRIKGVDGLKTGWTIASGYNLIITASRGKTRLLAIILGCSSREGRDSAAIKLLEAGFKYPALPLKVRRLVDS